MFNETLRVIYTNCFNEPVIFNNKRDKREIYSLCGGFLPKLFNFFSYIGH